MTVTDGPRPGSLGGLSAATPAPGTPAPANKADMTMDEQDFLLPLLQEATAGDYEIIGELGRGGMAAVYLANDLSLNRKVAIKTMLPELIGRQQMVQRFKREAQMAAGLSHPHIVQIHSVKQTNRLVYFVMKFIEGRGLDSIIAEHGPLDLDMTRLILQQAASALSFAHHRGVVHRDIKPPNIMIDENGWAVVTDFGIAKVDDGHNLTATGTSVGTPHYMAPEQFHNKDLTAAADQYALGIVAYEMLSGSKPFDGSTLAEIITQHLFTDPPDVCVARPDLPASVSQTITRMLAKEPEARFPELDQAIASLGQPNPAALDAVRGRLMSMARSGPERQPRLSAPMSPVPSIRPSAPTTPMQIASVPSATPAPRTPPPLRTPPPSASGVRGQTGAGSAATPIAGAPVAPSTPSPASRTSAPAKRRSVIPWLAAALVILGVAGWFGAQRFMAQRASPENNEALQRGIALWQQGMPSGAEGAFEQAARELPQSALPHIYLARIARERGDFPRAFASAAQGARLEPNNALALREVGSVLLARGDNEGARRFLVRAIRANPQDRASMGWLACAFHRMGQPDQAARWSGRAGAGAWQNCLR